MKLKHKFVRALIALIVVILFSCGGEEKKPKEIIRPVRYQQVFLSGGSQIRTFSGISKAGTETNLSFRVGGMVLSVNVKVGDRIKKGKLIASIDNSDAKLQHEKALVALDRSRIQRETAKSTLDRVKGLYENNNVSLSEYEAAKANYATANSTYDADKRNVDLQERTLSYYNLFSPMNGIVTAVNIEKNENARPGQVIAIMNAGDEIEVTAGIPESFISRVTSGAAVIVRFSSIPDKVFDGKISEVSYTSGNQSSTYPVTVVLSEPTQEIRPGMPADVTFNFESESKEENLMVQANAVGEDTAGNFVFTVTATDDGFAVVNKKSVTVGRLTSEGYEILNGLHDGDLVVTAGIANLADGMKVRLLR
jgi:RND family efflux transporter MFP subunit